jgi:hypothetical protein
LLAVRPPWRLRDGSPDFDGDIDLDGIPLAPAEEKARIERITPPDMVFTILRHTLGFWPEGTAAGDENIWVQEQFDVVDGEELYDRWQELCDAIDDTDFASICAD